MAALLKQQRNVLLRMVSVSQSVRCSKRSIASSIAALHHCLPEEKVTHTGQAYAEDDFRRARFVDKQKEFNPNFSEKLIDDVAPIEVNQRVVSCDGGGGALGHPKVYINLDRDGPKACGYCGLRFVKKGH